MSTRTDVTQSIQPVRTSLKRDPRRISEYFGVNTFSEEVMHSLVSSTTFQAYKKWQTKGTVITAKQANEIAEAMKEWAVENGATAYTHWFQPMTGLTAEKHDSFIGFAGSSRVLERFSGDNLIHGEPDASSFPSGGLRATFEARGYTAWDPSSPAFIAERALGSTLCIPCIFVSYTGEALDKKLPLLRSDDAINRAAASLLRLFGDKSVHSVHSTCGPEQEYFLIDEKYFRLRPDLILTGRTLLGAPSPKHQQLEDQYFGSIKERVLNYMYEVTEEACKLGIPVATRHNEVAPHQYEFAPIFERANIAADHNQLLMDIMKRAAKRHGLECLLHEKPFGGINGSGKHLNWSLADDKGTNLLEPGDKPEENLRFLTILVAVVQAVYEHADLLRASVASAGNEHRLGANEAPPAIVSVFLGEQLTRILEDIEKGKKRKATRRGIIDSGVRHLPKFARDTTDRNRTSPFAFTGNKFEFRMLGSSLNISTPITVLNTVVAQSLDTMMRKIRKEARKSGFADAVKRVLAQTIRTCKPILFDGNNYAKEWEEEALQRGLPNEPSTPGALKAFVKSSSIALFEKYKVFSRSELEARYSVWLDIYCKVIEIETRTLIEMVNTQVLPVAYDFQIEVGNGLDVVKEMAEDETIPIPIHALDDRKEMFAKLTADIFYIRTHAGELVDMLAVAGRMENAEKADYLHTEITPHMKHVRHHVDDLESMAPDDLWEIPKYREMLFIA